MTRDCPTCDKEVPLETTAGWPDRYGTSDSVQACPHCGAFSRLTGDEDYYGSMIFWLESEDENDKT